MRKVILPFDGYPTARGLFEAMDKTLAIPGLSDLVAFIKLNDGLHNEDMGGPAIVKKIQKRLAEKDLPIGLFIDLKIYDVSATLVNVLKKYQDLEPGILTVSSGCSVEGIIKLRRLLPKTKLAMVSLLTDISEDECAYRLNMRPAEKIKYDLSAIRAIYGTKYGKEDVQLEPFDLVVCSPLEVSILKKEFPGYQFIVPGIRDEWMKKKDEHQKRTTGVKEAIESGADFVVMGAQLTKGNPELGITPEESCRLTMEEFKKISV